jgi:hypothetical protein
MPLFVDMTEGCGPDSDNPSAFLQSAGEKFENIQNCIGFLGYLPWLRSFFGYHNAGVSNRWPATTFVNCISWYTKYTVIGQLGVPFVAIFTRAARRTAPQNSCGPLLKMGTPFLGNISSSWKFPFVNLIYDREFVIFIAAARMIKLHGTFHAL